jgi:hypothetical protein
VSASGGIIWKKMGNAKEKILRSMNESASSEILILEAQEFDQKRKELYLKEM